MQHRPVLAQRPERHWGLWELAPVLLARLAPESIWSGDGENARRCRTILLFWLIGALPWPLVFATVYGLFLDCPAGAWICLACFTGFLPVPALLRRHASPQVAGNWIVLVMAATLTALGCITGGSGSPALTWLLPIPLIAIHITGLRAGLVWCGVTLFDVAGFDALRQYGVEVPQHLAHHQLEALGLVGNIGVITLVATLAATYDAQRQEALRLAAERQLHLREALQRTEEHAVELARSTEALRISEALYRSLVHNSPMGMLFYELRADDALVLTDANPAADQLTGVDVRARIGLTIEEAFPGLRGTEAPDRYRAAARGGAPVTVDQMPYNDGQISGVYELRAFQTAPRKMVVVFMNVTDRGNAEAAVRASEREIALQAGKAEVATDVLHNVGNVLSRVKIATALINERLRSSEVSTLGLVAQDFAAHERNLGRFLTEDERGRQMPAFLGHLAAVLQAEQASCQDELRGLSESIEHLALIVSMQQKHSKSPGMLETVRPAEALEQALSMSVGGQRGQAIEIVREFEEVPALPLYRHKVVQILVNLLNNARLAVLAGPTDTPRITIGLSRLTVPGGARLRFRVVDNGVGIRAENLDRIFTFGFTTRQDGHGFGLHSAANLAQEMGGTMAVASDGPGRGATFTLELPVSPVTSEKVQHDTIG